VAITSTEQPLTSSASTDTEPPLVDSHFHIFPLGLPYTATAHARPDYSLTVEEHVATMDEYGVQFGVVAAMSLTGFYNDYVVDSLRANRRLRGTVYVPPTITHGELREMDEAGVVGIRLFRSASSFGDLDDLETHEYQVLLRRVRDLNWHVHVVGVPEHFGPTLDVLNAAGVKIVVDHFGHVDLKLLERSPHYGAILRSVDLGRTWIKISGGFRLTEAKTPRTARDYAEARERERHLDSFLLDKYGTDRLVWGSDAPFVGHEGAVTYKDRIESYVYAIPSDATRRAIDRTALKLYFS
jgi:predicted TIM-barrel fold metal-dependent hydrolase